MRDLFPKKDIQAALGIDAALSQEMILQINEWFDCWRGRAHWLDKHIVSLRLEKSITREFANVVLNEMTAKVSNAKLDKLFQQAVRDINIGIQEGFATGATVIKPLGGGKVQYVPQSDFIPIEYDANKRLVKVIFPEYKKLGDHYYTRLEYHDLDPENGLVITNRAFKSSTSGSLGREIPLSDVEEWAGLNGRTAYALMKRPAFGYYRNPIANTVDGSPAGMSIFEAAINVIKKADRQFGRIDWEFESGERAVHVDETALRPSQTLDGIKPDVPKLNDRLYKGLNIAGGQNGDFFREFSPQLRQADFIAGLEEYKREIEFAVGLAYGDISNPQTVDKTATEVIASKQRKYNSVSAIQDSLRDCLDDLVYAIAFWNAMTNSGYEFVCDFKDSILTDEQAERQQDMQDLANGTLRPEEYRAKWRGEDIQTALKNLPQTASVID